jgi:2-dehydro-3-deoxyphosphogluconate aldolase/(4S)-4-hydroxy-2-oxoglutarate aldolase
MIELIKSLRIVPVVAISDASKAADLAAALVSGGLPIAEITLRTPASLEALKIAANNKDLFVGVGSLRTGEDLKKAIDVGAKFAVSAGFSPSVAIEANKQGIPSN